MTFLSPEEIMRHCLALAGRGEGTVEPNPCVGAAVVRNDQIIAEGWHKNLGGAHAEIEALHEAGEAAHDADLYVTLEPCSTTGRTGPCVTAIIKAGIRRVFIGTEDPNPEHAGRALKTLKDAGIAVQCGIAEAECRQLIEPFVRQLHADRPVVIAKWASTLDGRAATRTRDSKWITGEAARSDAHAERARCDAILIGAGTVLDDNPSLTVRHIDGNSPRPVVLDSNLRTPLDATVYAAREREPLVYTTEAADPATVKLFRSAGVVVETAPSQGGRPDLDFVLRDLKSRGVGRLMVEGGPAVLGAFIESGYVDLIRVYIAPRVLGDAEALSSITGRTIDRIADTVDFTWIRSEAVGEDIVLIGRPRHSQSGS